MSFNLSEKEKNVLLTLAREAISAKLEGMPLDADGVGLREKVKSLAGGEISSALSAHCGAFVTLHKKSGGSGGGLELRGCIGMMRTDEPLYETIYNMALAAAFNDYRFTPLTKEEFKHCKIEISVLSPMELCTGTDGIEVGVHGLFLTLHGRSGVLLPQVPVEQGWDRDEFLRYICVKAGLPQKSYESEGARLMTFTACVFGEAE